MDTNEQDDDDKMELPADTLAALQEFYDERVEKEKKFEDLKQSAESQASTGPISMDSFSEDWNASQFWYSDETAKVLAAQLLDGTTSDMRIALVSSPSAFVAIKNMLVGKAEDPAVNLLEFDERFNIFPEFVHYDFHYPLKLPASMKGRFDRILCDPPFLSADCQTKAAMTCRWLLRERVDGAARVVVCTGERMGELVCRLYRDMRLTDFEPRHKQDRLSNDFRCYANYESNAWKWR